MTFRSPRLPLLLAASALLLTGCATTSPVDRPDDLEGTRPPVADSAGPTAPPVTPVPAATQTPRPEPTQTPEPEPTRPALEDLVLTSEGLGTIRFGDDPADYDPQAAMLLPEQAECENAWQGLLWYPAYPDHPFSVAISTEPREIDGIAIRTDAIRTEAGLRIGMTFGEALALYPEATLQSRNASLERYVVDREPADLFFLVGSAGFNYVIDETSPIGGLGAATAGLDSEVGFDGFGEGCI